MGGPFFLLVMGVLLVVLPERFLPLSRKAHARRLSELKAGEAEVFFEEKRSLEAYPPTTEALVWRRVAGVVMITTALAVSVINAFQA